MCSWTGARRRINCTMRYGSRDTVERGSVAFWRCGHFVALFVLKVYFQILPSLLKMDLPPFHIDPAVQNQIERQAPRFIDWPTVIDRRDYSILKTWYNATCPTWKPLYDGELTVYPLKSQETMNAKYGRYRITPRQASGNNLGFLKCFIITLAASLQM